MRWSHQPEAVEFTALYHDNAVFIRSTDSEDSGLTRGEIAGIAIGGTAVLLLILLVFRKSKTFHVRENNGMFSGMLQR